MKTTPLKGMKDILPREQRIRDYVQGEILKTYRAAGFERISHAHYGRHGEHGQKRRRRPT